MYYRNTNNNNNNKQQKGGNSLGENTEAIIGFWPDSQKTATITAIPYNKTGTLNLNTVSPMFGWGNSTTTANAVNLPITNVNNPSSTINGYGQYNYDFGALVNQGSEA